MAEELSKFSPAFWDKMTSIIEDKTQRAVETLKTRLDNIDQKLTGLSAIEKSVEECKSEVENIRTSTLPEMSNHLALHGEIWV